MSNNSRRTFIKQTVALSAAAGIPGIVSANDSVAAEKMGKGAKILFQGDSITDGNRTRDNDWNHIMGHGYAYLISSRLWYEHPEREFHFYNRGVSGDKVTDLAARWQTDTLDIKPDVLSIMVGVNDVLAGIGGNAKFTAETYEADYRALLKRTKDTLPAVKLVICGSFILPVGKVKDSWDQWNAEVIKRQTVARKLAEEFNAVWVDFQQPFNDALAKAPASYWIWDGVHPMPAGHELMARQWLKVVGKKIGLV